MIYFLSDAHLGSRLLTLDEQHEQERKLCRLLDQMSADATAIYLLGDMIDFWFEYRYVVPRGFTRFFGKLSQLVDKGIEVHYFIGNHDIWLCDYLQTEIGLIVHRHAEQLLLCGKQCLLAHGDDLVQDDKAFSLLRAIFHSSITQWLFRYLLPTWIGMPFGLNWSRSSRQKERSRATVLKQDFYAAPDTPDRLYLVQYAKQQETTQHLDYYIFGHLHIPLQLQLATKAQVVILGDMMHHYSYGQLNENGEFELNFME